MKHLGLLINELNPTSLGLLFSGFLLVFLAIITIGRKKNWSISILFVASICLGFGFALIDPFFHIWDEQYHALVAKNLLANPLEPRLFLHSPLNTDYTDWTRNEVWLHKQPLSLWQIALSIGIFGKSVLAVRIPSILFHALLVFPIYRMGKLVYNQKSGIIAAIIFTLLNYPLELAAGVFTADHVDVSFLFYITLSGWAWFEYQDSKSKKWLVLIGVFSGFAVLTKWLVGLLVYAGFGLVTLLYDFRKKNMLDLFSALLITVLIAAPWQLNCWINFPSEFAHEMAYNSKHLFEVIEDHGGDWRFYWDNISLIYKSGLIIQLVIVLSLISLIFSSVNLRHKLFLLTTIFFPYLFFSIAATKMDSFLVIVIPLVTVVVVGETSKLSNLISLFVRSAKLKTIARTVFLVYISFVLINPKKIVQNHLFAEDFDPTHRLQRIAINEFISTYAFPENEKVALFNADMQLRKNIVWMFYKDIAAYNHRLYGEDKWKLLDDGYTIYIVKELEGSETTKYLVEKHPVHNE